MLDRESSKASVLRLLDYIKEKALSQRSSELVSSLRAWTESRTERFFNNLYTSATSKFKDDTLLLNMIIERGDMTKLKEM